MIYPKIWQTIPHSQIQPAKIPSKQHKRSRRDGNAKVTQQDQILVFLLVQRTLWIEVVDASSNTIVTTFAFPFQLLLMVVMSGHVGQQIPRPAEELLNKTPKQRHDGRLLRRLGNIVCGAAHPAGILGAGLGHEDHVALEVAGGLVVLAVRDLPAEVGHQQRRVQQPADRVVQPLRRRERLVPALVRQHPQPRPEQALHERIRAPQPEPHRRERHRLRRHVLVEDVEGRCQASYVSGHVGEAARGRPLEAVRRDGIADLLDGVVGDLEFVAVAVDEGAAGLLEDGGGVVEVAQRRQRGSRG